MSEENENPIENTPSRTPEEQLGDLINKATKQIEAIQAQADSANSIVSAITEYNSNLEKLKLTIDTDRQSIQDSKVEIEGFKATAEAAKNSTEEEFTKISSLTTQINENLTTSKEIYESFIALKEKVNDPNEGIQAILEKCATKKSNIDKLETESEQALVNINLNLESVAEKTSDVDTAYNLFLEANNKIIDENTGLLAILSNANKTQTEIESVKKLADKLHTNITSLKDNSIKLAGEIDNFKIKANADTEEIGKFKVDSLKTKALIEETLQVVADTSLANHFNKRKVSLEWPVLLWLIGSFLSILLLAIAVWLLFRGLLDNNVLLQVNWVEYVVFRISIMSPILYLIYFTLSRYSKERELLERYAFKAITGSSLFSYTTLLNNSFLGNDNGNLKENETKILDFVLNSMHTIYAEPYEQLKGQKVKNEDLSPAKTQKIVDEVINKLTNSGKIVSENDNKENEDNGVATTTK